MGRLRLPFSLVWKERNIPGHYFEFSFLIQLCILELYDDFIAVNRKKDPEERLNGIRRLVHMLPGPHYETLKFLINHLRKISDNSEVNKVSLKLAGYFGVYIT